MTTDIDLFGTPYTGITYDAGTNNIDKAVPWPGIGKYDSTWLKGYRGTFDGDWHSVSNMYSTNLVRTEGLYGGFIELLGDKQSGGTIQNFGVQSGKVARRSNAGGVVGLVGGSNSSIQGCWNAAEISSELATAGGVVGAVGYAYDNVTGVRVEGCYNLGTVLIGKGGTYGGGGVAGKVDTNSGDTIIRNSYNLGSIMAGPDYSSGSEIGGIIGFACGRVEYCYNAGNIGITGEGVGAIAGTVWSNGTVKDCYYDTANSTGSTSAGKNVPAEGARSLTTAQLQSWAAAYALNRNKMYNPVSAYGQFTWKAGEYPSLCYAGSTDYDAKKLQPAENWEVIGQGVKDQLLKDSAGTLIPEPVKDGTGAYSIESAEQLGWFGMTVNDDAGNQTLNANLTKDIDLLGERYGGTEDARIPWIPIETYQGHLGEGQPKL